MTGNIAFRDLKGRLKGMGIFQIIMGSFSAFFALIMILAASALKYSDIQRAQLDPKSTTMALLVYIIGAVFFIWIGIASVRAEKWVRPVILSLMVPSLIVGSITFLYFLYAMPKLLEISLSMTSEQLNNPAINMDMIKSATYIFSMFLLFIIYIIIPLVHILVYKNKDVILTCEKYDSATRWTDNKPIQIIAVSIWLFLSGCLILFYMVFGIFPFFGILITGIKATICYIILAILYFGLAYFTYKLKFIGWIGSILTLVILGISLSITFIKIPMMDLYKKAGYSDFQLEIISKTNAIVGKDVMIFSLLCLIAGLAYIVYTKKFYKK